MLDVIVLVAMAVTAAAVAAGLTLQAGLPLLPVLIATAALFLVMSSSFLRLGRAARGGGGGERVDELEEALEIIDADLQRIDRVEDDIARLDLLADRVERLDQALSEVVPGGTAGGQARAEELATEFENVYARIEALRADMEAEARSQGNRIASDLSALERMVKKLTGDTTAATVVTAARSEPPPPPPPPPVLEIEETEVEIDEPFALETADEPLAETSDEPEPEASFEPEIGGPIDMDDIAEAAVAEEPLIEAAAEEPAATESFAASIFDDDEEADDKMRDTIRKAVERGRVDLYLQPTVTLPDRRVRYFEALTRIRTADDDLVLPGDYVPVAKRAGMMPLIDNVLLVRSVQALRQLAPDSKVKGVFCNVSMHSLLDPDYFPELVEFMEENSGLSEKLIFEISQPELLGLTEAELGCLDTLGALGYTFCIDGVSDLDADFAGLSDRYFRYVKVSAALFLGGPGRTAAELKQDLDGLGMQLIIERVENEGDVADLLDHGIEFAQGHLFSEPKPSDEALSHARESVGAI